MDQAEGCWSYVPSACDASEYYNINVSCMKWLLSCHSINKGNSIETFHAVMVCWHERGQILPHIPVRFSFQGGPTLGFGQVSR